MAISRVAGIEAQGTLDGATSSSIDTTGADLLVLVLISYGAATEPTVSDSKSNTWTQATAYSDGTTRTRIYYAVNPTVGSGHTFTASGTGSYPTIGVTAWSGCDTSSPFDQENGNSGFSSVTSATTGSVTPTVDNELLVAGWGLSVPGEPSSPSVNSSFTLEGSLGNVSGQSFGVAHAYKIQTTAGAENPQLSWSAASNGTAGIATFKAAAGGSSVPRQGLTLLGVG